MKVANTATRGSAIAHFKSRRFLKASKFRVRLPRSSKTVTNSLLTPGVHARGGVASTLGEPNYSCLVASLDRE